MAWLLGYVGGRGGLLMELEGGKRLFVSRHQSSALERTPSAASCRITAPCTSMWVHIGELGETAGTRQSVKCLQMHKKGRAQRPGNKRGKMTLSLLCTLCCSPPVFTAPLNPPASFIASRTPIQRCNANQRIPTPQSALPRNQNIAESKAENIPYSLRIPQRGSPPS